jgi:hypothetical protein
MIYELSDIFIQGSANLSMIQRHAAIEVVPMAHHQALVAHHLLLDQAQVLCRNILMVVTVYNHGLVRIFAQTLLY